MERRSTRTASVALLLVIGVACCVETRAGGEVETRNGSGEECRCFRVGPDIELVSPAFVYRLNTADGLRGVNWENRRTGKRVPLGSGAEVECDLDASSKRIFITGWKTCFSHGGHSQPDDEPGYKQGFAGPEFDDGGWPGRAVPPSYGTTDSPVFSDYYWARTHVFLPREADSRALALVLGGFGLFDFRYLRVFVNGREVGVRRVEQRWSEPGVFDLGPRSEVYPYLRFGNDNIIAVQACGYRCRTAQLDAVDPHRHRSLSWRYYWGQFEQYLVVGTPLMTPKLRVTDVAIDEAPDQCEARFELASEQSKVGAKVTYRWNAAEPVLRKSVEIRNDGPEPIRVMNVRLGTYATGATVSEGEQGFPVYIDGQLFATLAHPAGWAIGQDGTVRLRQYPGKQLAPGEAFGCMEAVLGVAKEGSAREEFVAHVRGRMRRVVRRHDQAYAIFDCFGAWPTEDWWGSNEGYLLKQIQEVVVPEIRESNCDYDYYVVELWRDIQGDLERPNPAHYPDGFKNIVAELEQQRIGFGLWIATTLAAWTIGENPVVGPALTHDPAYGCDGNLAWLCLATDPLKTMLATAYINQISKNRLRLVKFDGTSAICYNAKHDHLPGVYSTEAIHNAFIQIMRELDQECPDLFIMLYWGVRSPWWLLYGDTLFEPGLAIEAAHPCAAPALYVRDSVTVGLDQAQRFCEDVPALGKDSLGVWLSNWGWNSGIGKERWQEGFVMDMGRGSLLAQPWSDNGSLTEVERRQLGNFIRLLKQHPDCFKNSRPVLGDPWKNEPYGYCCSNAERAFVTLNNCTWSDQTITLELGPAWGLPEGRRWDIYRWYPRPARLTVESGPFEKTASVSLRPFEVVLLEIVPAGTRPALDRSFENETAGRACGEPSRTVTLGIADAPAEKALPVPRENGLAAANPSALPPKRSVEVRCEVPPSKTGGLLVITLQMKRGEQDAPLANSGLYFAAAAEVLGAEVPCETIVPRGSFAAPWQGWRMAVGPSDGARSVQVLVTALIPADVALTWQGFFLPRKENP